MPIIVSPGVGDCESHGCQLVTAACCKFVQRRGALHGVGGQRGGAGAALQLQQLHLGPLAPHIHQHGRRGSQAGHGQAQSHTCRHVPPSPVSFRQRQWATEFGGGSGRLSPLPQPHSPSTAPANAPEVRTMKQLCPRLVALARTCVAAPHRGCPPHTPTLLARLRSESSGRRAQEAGMQPCRATRQRKGYGSRVAAESSSHSTAEKPHPPPLPHLPPLNPLAAVDAHPQVVVG